MAAHGTIVGLSVVAGALLAASVVACSSSSSPDGAGHDVDGGGGDGSTSPPPVSVPAKTWTWVDLPGTKCGNGQPTGMGVYVDPESPDVVFYMAGGGGCWDGATCYGQKAATYMESGYTKNEFESDPQALLVQSVPTGNMPLRGKSVVYIPYCTGDDHAGSNVLPYDYNGSTKTAYHVGYDNVGIALEHVATTWPRMKRLILMGVSAGGFGTVFNYDRVQRRFPDVRVDGIDDSGPMIEPVAGLWDIVREHWKLQLPPDCTTCTNVSGYFNFLSAKYAKGPNRFALVSYTFDSVISGYMSLPPATFNAELEELGKNMASSWPIARYYFIPGTLHVGLAHDTSADFYAWLAAMLDDDPKWGHHPN